MNMKFLVTLLAMIVVAIAVTASWVWNLKARVVRLENSNESLRQEITTRRIAIVDQHSHPRAIVRVDPQNEDQAQIMLLAPNGRELVNIHSSDQSGAEMVFNSGRKYGNVQIGRLPEGDVVTGQPPAPDSVLWGVKISLDSGTTTTLGITEAGTVIQPLRQRSSK
jgi:hypothetical protein